MSILDPNAAPAAPDASAAAPAADTPPANTAERPADAMEGAADKLFDHGKPGEQQQQTPPAEPQTPPVERNPALPPENETAEEKAAREAAETPEQKAAREAAEAEEAEKAKEGEKDERYGAPEGDAGYADFTLPEGVEIDADGVAELTTLGKELNLSQTSAQKLVDALIKRDQRHAEAATANVTNIREGWQTATRADKEFGGDKLNASLAVAQKALKQFGTPELNELVVGAGLGDHPEFIRLMVRVGNAVSESPIVHGANPGTTDAASVLYPNHPRKQ